MEKNKHLEQLMYDRRITPTKLSYLTGITRQTIYRLLNGGNTIKKDHLFLICKALDITPNDYYNWDNEKEQKD